MNTRKLTPNGRDALKALYEAAENGRIVIDADDLTHITTLPNATLDALHDRKLATPTTDGLWRITLGGLTYARNRWGKNLEAA